ncbi:MAG TPA: hypothetical protein VN714_25310 [Trebonia sp.]|jgi:hypothetical protein|nr:hypothetical protein [Trebonia sp.]
MTSQATAGGRPGTRKRTVYSLPALAGIGYAGAWIISQAVVAPSPSVAASGSQVVAAFAGHAWSEMVMFVFAEGVAAVALAVVVLLAARAARAQGAPRAGLTAAVFGVTAAVVSWAELAMGVWLQFGPVAAGQAGTAGELYHALNRIDGAKMFVLAVMTAALAAVSVRSGALPRWLAPLGLLAAVALVISGLSYVLLAAGLAASVYVSGTLLVIVVAATGVTLRVSP